MTFRTAVVATVLVAMPALTQQGDPAKTYPGWTQDAAKDSSLGFRGVGFALQKGTDDKKFTASQMCRLLRSGFKGRTKIDAECFFEQGKNVYTVIVAYIGGRPQEPRGVGPTIASFSEYADIHEALAAPLTGCRGWMTAHGIQPAEMTPALAQRFVGEFWPIAVPADLPYGFDRAEAIAYYQRHFSRHFEVDHNPFDALR